MRYFKTAFLMVVFALLGSVSHAAEKQQSSASRPYRRYENRHYNFQTCLNSRTSETSVYAFDCIKFTPYAQYRRDLIRRGYVPVRQRSIEGDSPLGAYYRPRFPEVMYCTGGGIALCKFVYLDPNKRYTIIVAMGETRPTAVGVRHVDRREREEIAKRGG